MIIKHSTYFKTALLLLILCLLNSCEAPEIDTADFTFEISLLGNFESFDKEIEIDPFDFNIRGIRGGKLFLTPAVTTNNSAGVDNDFVSTLSDTDGLSVFVKGATTVELEFIATTSSEESVEMTILINVTRNGEVVDTISAVFDNSSTESDRILKDYFVDSE